MDVSNGNRPADWATGLSADALNGKVIGVPATAFIDPFGTTGVSDALRAQFANFERAGATIVQIPDAPRFTIQTGWTPRYDEGWIDWIADHPDNPYTDVAQITGAAGVGMTDAEVDFYEAERDQYRTVLADWMDANDVDTVLYPAQLSDVHLNDSNIPSFGRKDPQSSDAGVPTVICPAGVNENGSPVAFQLQGKEYQDADLLAMAYAFENVASGRVIPALTPALAYDPKAAPVKVTPPGQLDNPAHHTRRDRPTQLSGPDID